MHSHGGLDLGAETSVLALVLRLALLLTTAVVAGVPSRRGGGFFSPPPPPPPPPLFCFFLPAPAPAAALVVTSVLVLDVNVIAAAVHVALVLAAPWVPSVATRWVSAALVLLLVVETAVGVSGLEFVLNTVYIAAVVAWFHLVSSEQPRERQLALSLGVALVLVGAVRLVTSGIAFNRRVYETVLGLVLLAVVLLPLAALLLRNHYAIALALVAWGALPAIPAVAELPEPGVPVLTEARLAGQRVPVLISPHRPGRNLVHFPAAAGNGIQVNGVAAVPRSGAEGTWAEVDLPAGRGSVELTSGTVSASVDVDPGDQPGPVVDPECATAALGVRLAGRREPVTSCPADSLSTEDHEALRKLVGFLDSRGAAGITLATDSSPRGVQAASAVRKAADEAGLRVDAEQRPDNALVAVGGWSAAYEALTRAGAQQAESPVYAHGLYVAPWLLHAPLATAVTTLSVPLRFDPREQLPVAYAVAAGNGFGGANPTPAGFRGWLGDQKAGDGVQIYAVAQVTAMPMGPNEVHAPGMPMTEELAGQWIPKATVVPVSPILS